ncbi:MAG TPA: hypothetical protein VHC70_08890 [Phycisphaerales bacterium]|jgi:hypothetical protein|nr:hypothetical protein [Phycisphaerales bacterium]
MRWIRDIALLILLGAVAAYVAWYQYDRHEHAAATQKTAADTQRLEREVRFRAATKGCPLNWRGWPVTIDPAWFDKDPAPTNSVAGEGRPWVEVATEDEAGLLHPRQRMTVEPNTAAFWYNPYQGVVRARVPVQVNDEQATDLYNAVNQCTIPSIGWVEKPMDVPKPKTDKLADGDENKDHAATDLKRNPLIAPSEHREPVVVVHPEKKP